LQLGTVKFSERAGERPLQRRRLRRCMLVLSDGSLPCHGQHPGSENESGNCALDGHDRSHLDTTDVGGGAEAPIGTPSRNTDSVMELGSGFVFSKMPSSGRMRRKCAK
jgi:hypothetical protein